MFNDLDPTSWLTVPRWLWHLALPLGAASLLGVTLIVAAGATAITAIEAWRDVRVAQAAQPRLASSPPPTHAFAPPPAEPNNRCPYDLRSLPSYRASADFALTCACAPEDLSGSIWGTDVYTSDSSLCAAAVHAGAIGYEGGTIHVQGAPGRQRYPATTRHDIASLTWDAWDGSFFFPQRQEGRDE